MSDRCPRCGAPVLVRADDGRLLEPEPARLGVQHPDGGTVGVGEVARGFFGTGPLLGHYVHRCGGVVQDGLFDGVAVMCPPRPGGTWGRR